MPGLGLTSGVEFFIKEGLCSMEYYISTAHEVSSLDSTCHLTHKLSLRFWGLGLVVGVPPTSIVQGISGVPPNIRV